MHHETREETRDRTAPPTVFLGGPIQHLLTHDNSDWVVASHQAVAAVIRDEGWAILSAHEVEDYGRLSAAFAPDEVTERDLAWTMACDAYIAILPVDEHRVPYRTDGTHIEVGWASALGKPVVLVLDDEPAVPYSHLILGLVETGRARRVALSRWRAELPDAMLACVPDSLKAGAEASSVRTT